jgi:hypothetical protein
MEAMEEQRAPRLGVPGYQMVRAGAAVLVRLDATPTPVSVARLVADVAQVHAELGRRIVYVAVVPRDATAVPAEVRP